MQEPQVLRPNEGQGNMSNRERLLEGFLSDEPSEELLDTKPIAARVARMVSDPIALAHWRKIVRVAFNESEARHRVHADWESQRDQIFRTQGKATEPPQNFQPLNDSVIELGSVVQVLPGNKIESKR